MAKYIVPPRQKKQVLIKCWACKTLYAPDMNNHPFGDKNKYESCPVCKTDTNGHENEISLWRYNLIKYWRGLFDREQTDTGGSDD